MSIPMRCGLMLMLLSCPGIALAQALSAEEIQTFEAATASVNQPRPISQESQRATAILFLAIANTVSITQLRTALNEDRYRDPAGGIVVLKLTGEERESLMERLVSALSAQGRHAEATAVAEQLVQRNAGRIYYRNLLTSSYLKQERYAQAVASAEKSLAVQQQDQVWPLMLYLEALIGAKRQAEALARIDRLMAADPRKTTEWLFEIAEGARNEDKPPLYVVAMEALRARGKLDRDRYVELLGFYQANTGREKETIAVISDGLASGKLPPVALVYDLLAGAYFITDQVGAAIEAWQKGAPLSDDGNPYLKLARALVMEDRIAEAKQAARSALDKGGLSKPEEAHRILALP